MALSQLEYLVHTDRKNAPRDLVSTVIEVPDDAIEDGTAPLPAYWNRIPPPGELRTIGDAWIRSGRSLALRVPSAVVPDESNVLINPAHARVAELVVAAPVRVILDPRLSPKWPST